MNQDLTGFFATGLAMIRFRKLLPLLLGLFLAWSPQCFGLELDRLLSDVSTWWVLDEGATLVVQKDKHLLRCHVRDGTTTTLCPEPSPHIRQIYRIRENLLGYDIRGQSLCVVKEPTGKKTVCIEGGGDYEPFGFAEDRSWFMLLRASYDPAEVQLYQIDPEQGKARKVYATANDIWKYRISPDHKSLVFLSTSSTRDKAKQITIDLESLKKRESPPPQESLEDHVVAASGNRLIWADGRTYLATERAREDLFPKAERTWGHLCFPETKPNLAAVSVLVEPMPFNRRPELWIVDLKTKFKTLIADAKQENIARRWSSDGRYFLYQRLRGDRSPYIGDLVVYEMQEKKEHLIAPVDGTDYVWARSFLKPHLLLVACEKHNARKVEKGVLAMVDLSDGDKVTILKEGISFSKPKTVQGVTVISDYNAATGRYTLYRLVIPE